MHFEHFHYDLAGGDPVDASVGDEAYSGATVVWGKVMRADRAWIADLIGELLAAWLPEAEGVKELRLHGEAEGDAQATYRLEVSQGAGWVTAPPLSELDPGQQAVVRRSIDAILETIHGLLLIH